VTEEENYMRVEQQAPGSMEHPILLVEQEQRDDIITKALSTSSSSSPSSPSRNHRKRQGGIWNKILFFGNQSNHPQSPSSAAPSPRHHFHQSATQNVRFSYSFFNMLLTNLESLMQIFLLYRFIISMHNCLLSYYIEIEQERKHIYNEIINSAFQRETTAAMVAIIAFRIILRICGSNHTKNANIVVVEKKSE
jgi:hypothetical protein